MATEDDNFDIDIYGDGTYGATGATSQEDSELILDAPENLPTATSASNDQSANTPDRGQEQRSASAQAQPAQPTQGAQGTQKAPASGSAPQQQAPTNTLPTPPQGTKRKEFDDQTVDPAATSALIISELTWWTTEDHIRDWISDAGAGNLLNDVTFSEHKVNGKSKG